MSYLDSYGIFIRVACFRDIRVTITEFPLKIIANRVNNLDFNEITKLFSNNLYFFFFTFDLLFCFFFSPLNLSIFLVPYIVVWSLNEFDIEPFGFSVYYYELLKVYEIMPIINATRGMLMRVHDIILVILLR